MGSEGHPIYVPLTGDASRGPLRAQAAPSVEAQAQANFLIFLSRQFFVLNGDMNIPNSLFGIFFSSLCYVLKPLLCQFY